MKQIRIVLKTIRPIAFTEELCFWPSFELNLALDIPFLTPSNIISGTCYICTACGKCYTQPNPLKIHIKFVCPLSNNQNQTISINNYMDENSSQASSVVVSTIKPSQPMSQSMNTTDNDHHVHYEKLYRNHYISNHYHCLSSTTKSSKHQITKVKTSCKTSSLYDGSGGHRKLHTCSYCG